MALIALKKDKDCLRVAVATSSRATGRLQFEHALTVELAGETEELSPARLGDKLRAILGTVGVQRGDVTVIVARNDVEMRHLQLPPVPDEELPEMVRFQARNHFTSFSDESLVDFVPLSRTDDHSTVLAAALSEEVVQRIQDIVEAAGLKLRHIVVRPFAAVELVRSEHPDPGTRVILEMIGREADISVVENDHIIMSRTVRVPDSYSDDQFDAWLPGEIHRTITAAQGQTQAGDPGEIVVCGSPDEHPRLAAELKKDFQVETRFLKPFDQIHKSNRLELPARHDGFASLLGSLVGQVGEDRRGLDFLAPRKKPESRVNRKKVYQLVGLAAALLLMGLASIWWVLGNKQAQISELQAQINEIRQFTDVTGDTIKNTLPLDNWRSRQVNWLEELYQLSQILPDPDKTRIGRFTANSARNDNAAIDIRGLLKDTSMRELSDRLETRPYSIRPTVDPTKEGGFDQEYRVALQFPFAKIAPDGRVLYFDDDKETPGEAPESSQVPPPSPDQKTASKQP